MGLTTASPVAARGAQVKTLLLTIAKIRLDHAQLYLPAPNRRSLHVSRFESPLSCATPKKKKGESTDQAANAAKNPRPSPYATLVSLLLRQTKRMPSPKSPKPSTRQPCPFPRQSPSCSEKPRENVISEISKFSKNLRHASQSSSISSFPIFPFRKTISPEPIHVFHPIPTPSSCTSAPHC